MNNHLKELISLMESTIERYKETPKWHYLQALFRLTLELGIEIGKRQALQNIELINLKERE